MQTHSSGLSPLGLVLGATSYETALRYRVNGQPELLREAGFPYLKLSLGGAVASLRSDVGQAFVQVTGDCNIPLKDWNRAYFSVTPQLGFGYRGVVLTGGFQVELNDTKQSAISFRAIIGGLSITPQDWLPKRK